METSLRIFLFICGVLMIAGIVWDAKRRKRQQAKRAPMDEIPNEIIQALDEELVMHAPRNKSARFREDSAEIKPLAQGQARRAEDAPLPAFISLSVMARYNQLFTGQDLLMAFKALDLAFGAHGIFHRYEEDSTERHILFSVASAIKPGSFELEHMARFTTRGLTLFMSITEPPVSTTHFELMLRTARHLAIKLKGELKDAEHEDLTIQAIETMREQVRIGMHTTHARIYESQA